MSILEIDTDALRTAVTTARQTNEAITEACTLLNQVVIHNDWECSERTQINENTVTNRQTAQEIQNHASAFYQAITQASAQFDEVEQNNITRINSVEGIISQIVSVVPGIAGGIAAPAISTFTDIKDALEG